MTSKLYSYTFEESGVTVQYKRISPDTLLEFKQWFDSEHPEPDPPMQQVTHIDGTKGEEENTAHPEYEKKVEDRKRLFALESRKLVRQALIVVLNDMQKEEVKAFRDQWRESYGAEIKKSDTNLYVEHIACLTTDDLRGLTNAVMRQGMPTEDAISEHIKSDKPDSQGN